MAVRFFMLQSHYRSTLDLTDQAMQEAEKGYKKLMDAAQAIEAMNHPGKGNTTDADKKIFEILAAMENDMNDDFNTPKALADTFELVNYINKLKDGHLNFNEVSVDTFNKMKDTFLKFVYDIFGFRKETATDDNGMFDGMVELLITIRNEARANKDWATSDLIRDKLKEIGIQLKDGKDGTTWSKIL
jgi:cysteinyl-tRNA synthetase